MLTIRRAGFTVMEVLVALVILVTLTAIMLPAVVTNISTANSTNLAANLKTINTAIMQYRENTGRYPLQLTQLITRPTTSSLDACSFTLPSSSVAAWSGPYIGLSIGANGIQSGDAVISNNLQRNPLVSTSSTPNGVLQLSVGSVTGANATDVEGVFDTGNDLDHGTITWIPTTGVIGTLTFAIPVRGC